MNKTLVTIVFLMCMMCLLVACGGNEATDSEVKNTERNIVSEQESTASDITENEPEESAKSTSILVVNFSCTGNTKAIAKVAANKLDADFYEIVPALPYTDEDLNYNNDDCRANKEQNNDNARPEIVSEEIDLSKYDTVLISFPIWWGKEPRIIDTFMEKYDFSGKNLAAFCTSGGSGISTAETNLKAYEPEAVWLGANRFEASAAEDEIDIWLSLIGLE